MEKKNCLLLGVVLTCAALLICSPAKAVDVLFQPRLEAGIMYYAFESEATNEIISSMPVGLNTGALVTQQAFEYNGNLPFVGAGGSFFIGRFFLDFSGQYAFDGHDHAPIVYSGYAPGYYDFDNLYIETGYTAYDTRYEAHFDRSDMAASLGYAFTSRFGMFVGYKWAKTCFHTTYQGTHSGVNYCYEDQYDGTIGGRMWGEAEFDFQYKGPFLGTFYGWDFKGCDFLKGLLTVNLALAYLEGKVVLKHNLSYGTIDWINQQQVPEATFSVDGGLTTRFDTKGETVGLTFGVGWRGATPWKNLSYFIGISGYRYEFDAKENNQSDINETAVTTKIVLAYSF